MLIYKKGVTMKNISTKNITNIFIAILSVLLIIFLSVSYTPLAINSNAEDTGSINGTIKVEAIARAGETLTQDQTHGNPVYFWKQLQAFKISFDSSKLPEGQEPPLAADGKYTITYSIGYYPGYLDSNPNNDEFVTYENVWSATTENYTSLPSYTFNVDNFLTSSFYLSEKGSSTEVTTQGWGVYQFTINVNGATATSNYFYVEPDHLTTGTTIEIAYKTASATSSLHNAYLFYVVGTDSTLKYVDKNCFVWYVYGKDFSDNAYVLTQADAGKGDFIEYGKWLYEDNAIDRTGEEFYFDDNNHSGNWNVYCVYEDDYTNIKIQSEEVSVMTGDIIEPSTIVWIIVGVSLGVLAIVIVVIVVSVKKEKVW